MRPRLLQWLVLFFTRPIRLSDFSALASRLKPRPKADSAPASASASAAPIAAQPAPSEPARKPKARGADARPSVVSSLFHPELEIGVSEQPLDSLPAELQDELVRPKSGRLQGSLSRQNAGETSASSGEG